MTTPRYLPRSWWADSDWPRGGAQLVDDDLHRLGNVNHYPGRERDFGIMTLTNLRHNLRGWYSYHVDTRGWTDIGYQMCVSMTTEGPVVVDLRGIGRVPAAHASASNPRANWHGGATLWTIGNTEVIHPDLIDAYRHFRHEVWLPRWPTATGVTHHRRVPGASTSCAGNNMEKLVVSGTLTAKPGPTLPPEDDELNETQAKQLADLHALLTGATDQWPNKLMAAVGRIDGTLHTDVTDLWPSKLMPAMQRVDAAVAKTNPALVALQTLVQQNAITLNQVLGALDGVDEATVAALKSAINAPAS